MMIDDSDGDMFLAASWGAAQRTLRQHSGLDDNAARRARVVLAARPPRQPRARRADHRRVRTRADWQRGGVARPGHARPYQQRARARVERADSRAKVT
jgi:hypothetical protein